MKRIAILGTGAISDRHIQAYQKFSDQAQVVALADLYPEKAREKAAKHGLEVPVFKDVTSLLNGCEFDAASICLPPFEHAPAAVTLLQAGKHVLTEKPMATCLQECDVMLEAAKESGALLGVVAQNRFQTPVMKLKRVLESGLAGKILHAQADSFWWRGSHYYDLWWRGTWDREGGGCTMNHAVHHIDLFLWLKGGLPAEVRSVSLNLAHENSEVEDFSSSVLLYDDGSVGQITASLVHHGEEQQLVFQGERAKVAAPWSVVASVQKENGFPEDNPKLAAEIQALYDDSPPVEHEGHDGQIANFLAAIDGREPLLVDGEQGRRTLELISAIYQAGHLKPVRLPLSPDAPFYTRAGILRHARHFHEKTKSVENFSDDGITLGRDLGR